MLFVTVMGILLGAAAVLLIQQWLGNAFEERDSRDLRLTRSGTHVVRPSAHHDRAA